MAPSAAAVTAAAVRVRVDLGQAYRETGQVDEAAAALATALEQDPQVGEIDSSVEMLDRAGVICCHTHCSFIIIPSSLELGFVLQ